MFSGWLKRGGGEEKVSFFTFSELSSSSTSSETQKRKTQKKMYQVQRRARLLQPSPSSHSAPSSRVVQASFPFGPTLSARRAQLPVAPLVQNHPHRPFQQPFFRQGLQKRDGVLPRVVPPQGNV